MATAIIFGCLVRNQVLIYFAGSCKKKVGVNLNLLHELNQDAATPFSNV